jgi:diguanylate cyclase (GGDEF)-like protein
MSEGVQADRPRMTDPLTGLMHREAWERHAPGLLEASHEARVPVCLVLLNVDDLDDITVRHGQEEGNRVLKEVAALWRHHVRQNDVLARIGFGEFAVTLIGCSLEAASAVARRLCGVLDPARLSASAGGSEWNGTETAAELLERAELALHHAKHSTADRIEIAADISSTHS